MFNERTSFPPVVHERETFFIYLKLVFTARARDQLKNVPHALDTYYYCQIPFLCKIHVVVFRETRQERFIHK